MPVTVRDLLAAKNSAVVYTCAPRESVAEACRLLRDRGVGCLVIDLGAGRLGLLEEREIAARVVAEGLDAETTRVEAVARPVPAVGIDTPGEELEAALRKAGVRHLPVVGRRGLLGVVSAGDLARWFASRMRSGLAIAG